LNTQVEENIKAYVREAEHRTRTNTDTTTYDNCVGQMNNLDLRLITPEEITNIIERFLLDWGWMARVVHRKDYSGWKDRVLIQIKAHLDALHLLRTSDLEEEQLAPCKLTIETCYGSISSAAGHVAATKILHLLCPSFFPIWDNKIGELVRENPRCSTGLAYSPIQWSGSEYYVFMIQIRDFLIRFRTAWSELAQDYGRSKVKMVDKYLWQNDSPRAWFI